MGEILLLYLWTRLDALSHVANFVVFVSVFATAGFALAGAILFIESEKVDSESRWQAEDAQRAIRYLPTIRRGGKIAVAILVCATAFVVLMPTKNDALLIGGGYIVLKAAQNEDVRARVGRIADLVEAEVEARIAELAKREQK